MAPRRRRKAQRGIAVEHWLVAGLAAAFVVAWMLSWPRRGARPPVRPALSAEEARAVNAAIPFAPGLLPAAAFRFHGSTAAREQAVACLATAALYEAGDDADGQRAVMQVILNRVRRPGFPKTVCGVVYQGATLPTGCQFSFACDGSATRRPEYAGRADAVARARRALAGAVFRRVGTATHYHGDYVVPYWIGSLDKVAAVGPHIFYRPHDGRSRHPALAAGASLAADRE
jgi:spore germination cell wall hydrolase CwlJ-like protein